MPSRSRIAIRSREERVERSDGRDKRCRGRRVVGRILGISDCCVDQIGRRFGAVSRCVTVDRLTE